MRYASLTIGVAIACAPLTALASDKDGAALTSQPWTGTQVKFSTKDKRASAALSHVSSEAKGFRTDLQVSAPLDEDTRQAALLDQTGLKPGFAGTARFMWDSRYRALAPGLGTTLYSKACRRMMEESGKDGCEKHEIRNYLRAESLRLGVPQLLLDKKGKGNTRKDQRVYFAGGGQVAGSFDQQKVRIGDPQADKESVQKWDIEAGARIDLWVAPIAGFTLQGGYKAARPTKFEDAQICQPTDMADPVLCKDEKYVEKKADVIHAGYARLAMNLIFNNGGIRNLSSRVVPGMEVRGALENLGTGAMLNLHFVAFVAPLNTRKVTAISGVGVQVTSALRAAADGESYAKGDASATPYLAIGAQF